MFFITVYMNIPFFLSTYFRLDEVECSFDNIRKVIGHTDFSILGKTSSCTLFYIIGDELENKPFDITMVQGLPSGCNDPVPFFYRKDNGAKITFISMLSIMNFIRYIHNSLEKKEIPVS